MCTRSHPYTYWTIIWSALGLQGSAPRSYSCFVAGQVTLLPPSPRPSPRERPHVKPTHTRAHCPPVSSPVSWRYQAEHLRCFWAPAPRKSTHAPGACEWQTSYKGLQQLVVAKLKAARRKRAGESAMTALSFSHQQNNKDCNQWQAWLCIQDLTCFGTESNASTAQIQKPIKRSGSERCDCCCQTSEEEQWIWQELLKKMSLFAVVILTGQESAVHIWNTQTSSLTGKNTGCDVYLGNLQIAQFIRHYVFLHSVDSFKQDIEAGTIWTVMVSCNPLRTGQAGMTSKHNLSKYLRSCFFFRDFSDLEICK